MTAPEQRTLVIDDTRVSYRAWGGKGGPIVLCLHGNPTSSFLWRSLGRGLADVATVIAPDLPGYGDSELGDRAGTWEEMEEFVEKFVEQTVEAKNFDLVLHDWGGLIGFRWLFDHPARLQTLRRLVVSDTGFFYTDSGAWHSLAKIWRTPSEGEAWMDALTLDAFREGMRAASPALSDEAVEEYWKGLATPERRSARLALYRSGDFEKIKPYDGKLGSLTCPTLIVWGENDPYVPPVAARRFEAEIPNTQSHVLSGVGHFLWEEAPERTLTLVRSFLTEG